MGEGDTLSCGGYHRNTDGDPEVKRIQTLNTDTLKQVSLSDSNYLTMFLAEKHL